VLAKVGGILVHRLAGLIGGYSGVIRARIRVHAALNNQKDPGGTVNSKRFMALLAVLALVVAACGDGDGGDDGEGVPVGLVYDIGGRGDQSFNDSAAAGLDRAVADFGIEASEASANEDGSNREELLNLQAETNDLVFGIGFLFATPMTNAATANPDVNFAIVDDASVDLPNVAGLVFAEEQGSFLVGAAAALKSETGTSGSSAVSTST
jgi:basic membrane protein A and related proteins